MSSFASEPISRVIDEYVSWLLAWHRFAMSACVRDDVLKSVGPPASFAVWQTGAANSYPQDQPAIERIAALHEQLHKLVRLISMKTSEGVRIEEADDAAVLAKYQELMQNLRRLERAFAAAASGLDPLTGLRTRKDLLHELERELSRFQRTGRVFCVAIADIDHFKSINDTYGHDVGDRVLASVADRISHSLRTHDDAFRLGGEEFLLCLKEADLAAGQIVIERLRKILRDKPVMTLGEKNIFVTLSFGLAVCRHDMNADEFLRRADEALYRAKNEGRDRVVVADG